MKQPTLLERTAALPTSAYYLTAESRAVLAAQAQVLKDKTAAARAERDRPPAERRSGERRSVDRRGAVTVEIDGEVVIRPRTDWTESRWSKLEEDRAA